MSIPPGDRRIVATRIGRDGVVSFASIGVNSIDGTFQVQRAATIDDENLPEDTVVGSPVNQAAARGSLFFRHQPHLAGVHSKLARFVLDRRWERLMIIVTIIMFLVVGMDCFILMLSRHKADTVVADIPLPNSTLDGYVLPIATKHDLYYDEGAHDRILWTKVIFPPIFIVFFIDAMIRLLAPESQYDEKGMHWLDLIILSAWFMLIVVIINYELFDYSVRNSSAFVVRLFCHITFWSNNWRRFSIFIPWRNNRDAHNIPGQTPRQPVEVVGTPIREPSYPPPDSMISGGTVIAPRT